MLMSVGYSDIFAAQSDALDYIYQIHNAAANVAFAQQMAVSYFWADNDKCCNLINYFWAVCHYLL